MPEPIKSTQPTSEPEQRPDRPRYEPPVVVHIGNSHEGQGGALVCAPAGSSALGGCNNGPTFD